MSERQFEDIARGDSTLRQLTREANALMALDQVFRSQLPPQLAEACRAVRIRDGELVVFANNGIVAARLRMMGNSLLAPLEARGYSASKVRIKVDIHLTPPPPPPKRIGISQQALAEIEAGASQVSNPLVSAALARLIAHHKSRS
ncbi:DciA family protein [Aquitalea denitrificans]|uniref:DciA family protein n=1 Tax=Aquitalea denitrificans TaxID=519081 RepID=UPI001356DD67|nr:DciA family protein [Aquitalea denitrificans]